MSHQQYRTGFLWTLALVVFLYSCKATAFDLGPDHSFLAEEQDAATLLNSVVQENRSSRINRNAQKKLLSDLMSDYDSRVRPVVSTGKSVMVTIRMNLYQIIDVIEPSQTLCLYTWVTQMWKDEYLGWLPADYDNTTWLSLPYDSIWLPDTYLYNSVHLDREDTEGLTKVVVTTDQSGTTPIGRIRLMYPAIYQFTCKIDIRFFPFDRQTCKMIFSSWTHDSTATRDFSGIDYQTEGSEVLRESFVEHEEWHVVSFTWHRKTVNFSCCPHPWTLLDAVLVMQRKPLFYLVNLILPTTLITVVAVVGFFMPATTSGERTEKMNLGMTTLLAMAILLLMVSDSVPVTSESVPLLGLYYLIIILLVSVGTVLTAYVIQVQQRANYAHDVGVYARTLMFHWIARVLRMRPRIELEQHWMLHGNGCDDEFVGYNGHNTIGNNEKKQSAEQTLLHNGTDRRSSSVGLEKSSFTTQLNDYEVRRFEWEYVADILDRMFLILFLSIVVFVTVMLMVLGALLLDEGVSLI